jgi:hypothetical protein
MAGLRAIKRFACPSCVLEQPPISTVTVASLTRQESNVKPELAYLHLKYVEVI